MVSRTMGLTTSTYSCRASQEGGEGVQGVCV